MKPSIIAYIDLHAEEWTNETLFQYQNVTTYILPLHIDENGSIINKNNLYPCNNQLALNYTFIFEFNFQSQPVPAAINTVVLSMRPYIRNLTLLCIDKKPLFMIRTPNINKSLLSYYRLTQIIKTLWPEYNEPVFLIGSDLSLKADGIIENSISSIDCLETSDKLDYDSYRYYSHFRPFPFCSYYIPSCHALNGLNSGLYHNYTPDSYLDWIRINLSWSYFFHYPLDFAAVYIADLDAHAQINVNQSFDLERPKFVFDSSNAPMPDMEYGLVNKSNTAMSIHAFYPENLPVIFGLAESNINYIDYLITTTADKVEAVISCLQNHNIPRYALYIVPNHGRDVAPFMKTILPALFHYGYSHFIKIHTKKSLHRDDGSDWGTHLITSLISEESIKYIRHLFSLDNHIGLLAPPGSIIPITTCLNLNVLWLAELLSSFGISTKWALQRNFVAGSMFAGRVDILKPLIDKTPTIESYESEAGQVDATLAHAMERFLSIFIKHQNFDLEEITGDTRLAPAFGYKDSEPTLGSAKTLEQKISEIN